MSAERRIDPIDGQAYTFDELALYYKCKYKRKVIEDYWANTCKPLKSQTKLVPSTKAQERNLESAVSQAAKRLGAVAVKSRFHKDRSLSDDYHLEAEVLGEGVSGCVYRATSRSARGMTYAVKDFNLGGMSAHKLDELEAECRTFLSLDHPNVGRLVDVYLSRNKLSFVMECLDGGEVMDRVLEREQFSVEEAADTAYQMLLALNHVHESGFAHGDVKPENFMYAKKGSDHIKLIDFGSSRVVAHQSKRRATHTGTLEYAAPEVLISGCCTDEDGIEAMRSCIKKGDFTVQESWEKVSTEASNFVKKLLLVDPRLRLSGSEALQHPFIMEYSSLAADGAGAKVDAGSVAGLCAFSKASTFEQSWRRAVAWSMTYEERWPVEQIFLAMDRSKKGLITSEDFKACIKEHLEVTDRQADDMFASETGIIHCTDLLAAVVPSKELMRTAILKATFHRLEPLLDASCEGDCLTLTTETYQTGNGKVSYDKFVELVKESVKRAPGVDASFGGS